MKNAQRTHAWLRAILGFVVVLLVTDTLHAGSPPMHSEPRAERIAAQAWVAPDQARAWRWPASGRAPSHVRVVNPKGAIPLHKGDLLALPTRAGDRFQIRGQFRAVGMGTGLGDLPDVITWLPEPDESDAAQGISVTIPAWSSTRFLVIHGGPKQGEVQVRVSARRWNPVEWMRLDTAVERFATGSDKHVDSDHIPRQAQPLVRWLEAVRGSVGASRDRAFQDWLLARWLESSYRVRPISLPYFTKATLRPTGGRLVVRKPPEANAGDWYELTAGQSLVVVCDDADVVQVSVDGKGEGSGKVVVREGLAPVRVGSWRVPERLADAARWVPVVRMRAVPAGPTHTVSITAAQGTALVSLKGFRQEYRASSLLERAKSRRRRLERAAGDQGRGLELIRHLVALERETSERSFRDLSIWAAKQRNSSGARVLGLLEASRRAHSAEQALKAVRQAWKLSMKLPPRQAAPLMRVALTHLTQIESPYVAEARKWSGRMSAAHSDDVRAIGSLAGLLGEIRDGKRPLLPWDDERAAQLALDDPSALLRARGAWKREAPWRGLMPQPGGAVRMMLRTPHDTAGSSTCAVRAESGLRWTVLQPGTTTIAVEAPSGRYARIALRKASSGVGRETTVSVDGVAVAVHGAAGLSSFAAVRPGRRTFEVPKGSPPAGVATNGGGAPSLGPALPVLARIPRSGSAPCDTLREIRGWMEAGEPAQYAVPAPGRPTIAAVLLELPAGPSQTITVQSGRERIRAWARAPASGQVEVVVPAKADALRVDGATVSIRALARMHPLPAPSAKTVTRPVLPTTPTEVLLDRVRAATRRIEAAPSKADADAAKKDRAEALRALGFSRLALLDGTAGDQTPESVTEQGPVEAVVVAPGSPTVIPLGTVSQIPPLPLPSDMVQLARASAKVANDDALSAVRLLRESASRSTDAAALLLAVASEKTGDLALASTVFERIGRAHRSGVALRHAATLWADHAIAQRDVQMSMQAMTMAQEAFDLGTPSGGIFQRLSAAIDWSTPPGVARASGFVKVMRLGSGAEPSLGSRVRKARMDAPGDAAVVAERQHAVLHTTGPKRLKIRTRCFPLDGNPAACEMSISLDGVVRACAKGNSREQTCEIPLALGKHRLDVRAPPRRTAMGWISVSDDSGAKIPPRVVREWLEVTPKKPIELAVWGPTLIRVNARTEAGRKVGVKVRVQRISQGAEQPAPPRVAHIEIPSEVDPTVARILPDGSHGKQLSLESSQRIIVSDKGAHRVQVLSSDGRALARLLIASAVGLPLERHTTVQASAPPPPRSSPSASGPTSLESAVVGDTGVGEDPGVFPLSLGASILYADRNFVQEDTELSRFGELAYRGYVELQLRAYRELLEDDAWVLVGYGWRVRDGPNSYVVVARLDTTARGLRPGLTLSGAYAAQPYEGETAYGLRGTARLHYYVPSSARSGFVPWVAFTVLRVDRRVRDASGVDLDVYSPYAATHPRYLSGGLSWIVRPFIDMQGSIGASARSGPELDSIDRVGGRVALSLAPGWGLTPGVGVAWQISYRPETEQRSDAFLRNTLTLQTGIGEWLSEGHRVALQAVGRYIADSPSQPGPPIVTVLLAVHYDFTDARGLRDLAHKRTLFRDRSEDGSGRVRRREPRQHAAWQEGP